MIEEIRKIRIEELEKQQKILQQKSEAEGFERSDEITRIEQEISLLRTTNDIAYLIPSLAEAIKLLESYNITPTLNEEDKKVIYFNSNIKGSYSDKSDFIAVHKTRFIPKNNRILTTAMVAKNDFEKVEVVLRINGTEYQIPHKSARNTIHFAINGEVTSHEYGNWDDCKYAIFVPFNEMPDEKIARANPEDTYIHGDFELSRNCWILCPKEEVDSVKQNNPGLNVLGYEGNRALGYPKTLINILGYGLEVVQEHGWKNSNENTKRFQEICKHHNLKSGQHSGSKEHEDEMFKGSINRFIYIIKLLKDNNLIQNPSDINNVMKDLKDEFNKVMNLLNKKEFDINKFNYIMEALREIGCEPSQIYQETLITFLKQKIMPMIPQGASLDEIIAINTLQKAFLKISPDGTDSTLKMNNIASDFLATAIGNSLLRTRESQQDSSKMLIDNFVLDLEKKTIESYDLSYEDPFVQEFRDISQIDIERDEETKTQRITIYAEGARIPLGIITINEKNQIIGLESEAIMWFNSNDFLKHNTSLETIILPNLESVRPDGNLFEENHVLREIIVPEESGFWEKFSRRVEVKPKDIAVLARDNNITAAEIEDAGMFTDSLLENGKIQSGSVRS